MGEGLSVDLFGNPASVAPEEEPPPRGQSDNGLVRTTGWLRFGARTVSSTVVCAVIFLLHGVVVAVALGNPLVLPAFPVFGWALWHLVTVRLRPASRARDVGVVEARELAPNRWVRLHGSIGPAGRVASVASGTGEGLDVRFAGGTRVRWPAEHRVHLVELLD